MNLRAEATVSVIIPTLNEEEAISAALASAAGAHEVIVADGGSVDSTCEIVRRAGVRVVDAPRGRGVQLNAGAAVAGGEILLFLHADTRLPAGFALQVPRCLVEQGAIWGRFDLRFDAGGPLLNLISRLICWRSRLTRVGTGDQAIFVSRDAFDRLAGFHEVQIFEDIDLCRRLKRLGGMAIPNAPVVTSSRRWRSNGAVRTSLLMWALKLAYLAGVPSDRLARLYRDVR